MADGRMPSETSTSIPVAVWRPGIFTYSGGTAADTGPKNRAKLGDHPYAAIVHMLAELRLEHRDLDAAIDQLAHAIGRDELQLTRLKKRKLLLKDHISRLESKLIPDLDA